jgi:hypothetical protein
VSGAPGAREDRCRTGAPVLIAFAMWDTNPWAPWGIIHVVRDGVPTVTETGLWYLVRRHPDAVEPDGEAMWLYLDQPYRAERVADRAFYKLTPAPSRRRGG